MTGLRTSAVLAVALVWFITPLVVAQNPKPPTPLSPEIQSVDQLPADAVVLWIDSDNLSLYVDSTSGSEDQNRISTMDIRWAGPGPGFVEENCDWDVVFAGDFCCCSATMISKVRTRGLGPVFNFGDLVPEGYMETWNPADSWIVDGSYLTGGTLDKFDPESPYFGPVPEPTSLALLCVGLLLLRRQA